MAPDSCIAETRRATPVATDDLLVEQCAELSTSWCMLCTSWWLKVQVVTISVQHPHCLHALYLPLVAGCCDVISLPVAPCSSARCESAMEEEAEVKTAAWSADSADVY